METRKAEFEKVLKITDRFIACGSTEEVAFWLGYRHGIKHHLFGIDSAVPSEGHRCFIEVAEQGHSDKFIDAYAHGYQDGIDGKPPFEIFGERDGVNMTEITRFQRINGCSVCRHGKHRKDEGMLTAEPGKGFWCSHFDKAVTWKEGAVCPEWAYEK